MEIGRPFFSSPINTRCLGVFSQIFFLDRTATSRWLRHLHLKTKELLTSVRRVRSQRLQFRDLQQPRGRSRQGQWSSPSRIQLSRLLRSLGSSLHRLQALWSSPSRLQLLPRLLWWPIQMPRLLRWSSQLPRLLRSLRSSPDQFRSPRKNRGILRLRRSSHERGQRTGVCRDGAPFSRLRHFPVRTPGPGRGQSRNPGKVWIDCRLVFGGDCNILCFVMWLNLLRNALIYIKSEFGSKFFDCILVFGGDWKLTQ